MLINNNLLYEPLKMLLEEMCSRSACRAVTNRVSTCINLKCKLVIYISKVSKEQKNAKRYLSKRLR